jgi:uncharacterized protein YegP (UPF0339 family)
LREALQRTERPGHCAYVHPGKCRAGPRAFQAAIKPTRGKDPSGYFEPHRSTDEKFVFNLKPDNKEIILTSRTYTTKQHALDGIDSVRNHSPKDA